MPQDFTPTKATTSRITGWKQTCLLFGIGSTCWLIVLTRAVPRSEQSSLDQNTRRTKVARSTSLAFNDRRPERLSELAEFRSLPAQWNRSDKLQDPFLVDALDQANAITDRPNLESPQGPLLNSTFVSPQRRVAYINRRMCFEGMQIRCDEEWWQIRSIQPRVVLLQRGSRHASLGLADRNDFPPILSKTASRTLLCDSFRDRVMNPSTSQIPVSSAL